MTKEEITKIIQKELTKFEHSQPELGSTLGTPWTNEKVMSYIPKLQAALVEPYVQSFLLKDTYEQMNNETDQYAEYWVRSKEYDDYLCYDPKTKEFLKDNWSKYPIFRKTWASYKKVVQDQSQSSLQNF